MPTTFTKDVEKILKKYKLQAGNGLQYDDGCTQTISRPCLLRLMDCVVEHLGDEKDELFVIDLGAGSGFSILTSVGDGFSCGLGVEIKKSVSKSEDSSPFLASLRDIREVVSTSVKITESEKKKLLRRWQDLKMYFGSNVRHKRVQNLITKFIKSNTNQGKKGVVFLFCECMLEADFKSILVYITRLPCELQPVAIICSLARGAHAMASPEALLQELPGYVQKGNRQKLVAWGQHTERWAVLLCKSGSVTYGATTTTTTTTTMCEGPYRFL
jgi:hypothetical protein